MTRRTFLASLALAGAGLVMGGLPAAAQSSIEDFYRGRDVTFHIGGTIAGTYGTYATILSRHMGKHIPGNPNINVVPLEGAGGTRNLNFMADSAAKDGTVLSLPSWELIIFELFGHEAARFKVESFNWIGRLTDVSNVLIVSNKAGVPTLEEAIGKPLIAGSQGPRDHFAISPMLINHLTGTQMRVVLGYDGTSGLMLAMEQGESDAMTPTWTNVNILWAAKRDAGEIIPLVSITEERHPSHPDVPALGEFVKEPVDRAFFDIYKSQGVIGLSLIAPEGVPDERIEALRAAFDATMQDPEFLAEIQGRGLPLSPRTGEEMDAQIRAILATPVELVDAARTLYFELVAAVQN